MIPQHRLVVTSSHSTKIVDDDQKSTFSLSIVIPVYRAESIISILIDNIYTEIKNLPLIHNFEIILVNDASPDKSWNVICELSKKYDFIKGISLRRNFGQHNAIMAGLNHTSGDIIILMDDDSQHPPSAIPKLIHAITQGYDVCYTQYNNRQHEYWKKLGSAFNNKVATFILGKPQNLYLSSFKAMRHEIVHEIIKYDGPFTYIDGLILNVTSSITSIEIEHFPRLSGEGNFNLRSSISLWLKMLTGFSVLPLRFASMLGLMISALSFIMVLVVITQKIIDPNLTVGWASLISVSLFVGGIQLLCVGMMGEYLARTYLKINHKPQFVINHYTPDREL